MNHLIVVAKAPRAGSTKTRLSPVLDGGQAAALYEAMLRDTLDLARGVPGARPLLAYTPSACGDFFAGLAPDFECFAQEGAGLGERLAHALARSFAAGAGRAAVIDSDSPTLPPAVLAAAFAALDEADLALGPTADGGYYLLALKRPAPRLLTGVTMSSPRTAAETLERAAEEGLRARLLPEWYDVDTPDDLARLRAELRATPPETAPHTRAALDGM